MELTELMKMVDDFEGILHASLQQKYAAAYPPEVRKSLLEHSPVPRWDLRRFVEKYVGAQRYPLENLGRVICDLFDIKLQLYYLIEVDIPLYNSLVHDRGYDKEDPLARPHVFLTCLSLDQSLIAKSRILWERIMNFVYRLETGEALEKRVSRSRSKQKVFSEFVDENAHWTWLAPYIQELESYDQAFRTPEIHKASVLRAVLLRTRTIDPNELLTLVNRAINVVWENVLEIVSGAWPSHYSDLHAGPDGSIDKLYLQKSQPRGRRTSRR